MRRGQEKHKNLVVAKLVGSKVSNKNLVVVKLVVSKENALGMPRRMRRCQEKQDKEKDEHNKKLRRYAFLRSRRSLGKSSGRGQYVS